MILWNKDGFICFHYFKACCFRMFILEAMPMFAPPVSRHDISNLEKEALDSVMNPIEPSM